MRNPVKLDSVGRDRLPQPLPNVLKPLQAESKPSKELVLSPSVLTVPEKGVQTPLAGEGHSFRRSFRIGENEGQETSSRLGIEKLDCDRSGTMGQGSPRLATPSVAIHERLEHIKHQVRVGKDADVTAAQNIRAVGDHQMVVNGETNPPIQEEQGAHGPRLDAGMPIGSEEVPSTHNAQLTPR